MWMEELKNGKYKFRESYINPLTEKKKTVSVTMISKSRAAKKQAKIILSEKIQKQLEKLNDHDLIQGKRFEECIDEWLVEYKQQVKNSTYCTSLSYIRTVKRNIPADTLMMKISSPMIVDLLETLLYKDNRSNQYCNMIKGKMQVFFRWAQKKRYIKDNPLKDTQIKWKSPKPNKIENKFLEEDELQAILKYTWQRNTIYASLFEWLYQTGMRIGEALGLSFNDIEKGEDGIYIAHITGTLDYSNNLHVEEMKKTSSTKTPAGMRDVELSHRAIAIFKFLQNEEGSVGPLFQSRTGNVLQPTYLNTYLRKLKKILNIDKPLTTHIFRHTHISKLAELGVPLYVIQERVGHEDSSVTKKIYLHVTKKAHQQLVDKLDEL